MQCSICGKDTYDKFNNTYIISYCDLCEAEFTNINIFKNIIISKILEDYTFSPFIKSYMIKYFSMNFIRNNFGVLSYPIKCKSSRFCAGATSQTGCNIYQYEYHGFSFFFCYYNNMIIYNADDTGVLITYLYKEAKRYRFEYRLNKTWTFIKGLFIKEIKKKE